MTNAEAIEILRGRTLTMSMGFLSDEIGYVRIVNEAIDMAISALEKQAQEKPLTVLPCGDGVTPIKCTGLNCPMQAGKVNPATCKAADTCKWATKSITNADRIRGMTDEQLADWLKYERISVCPPDTGHIHCNVSDICADRKCWLDWLKQEVQE